MKILIWGTGRLAQRYMRCGWLKKSEIIGFIDSKPKEDSFFGKKVYKPQEASKLEYDVLLICVINDCKAIYDYCVAYKFPMDKILFVNWFVYEEWDVSICQKLCPYEEIYKISPSIANEMMNRREQYRYIYADTVLDKELTDYAFIRNEINGDVLIWVPVELLFSEDGDKQIVVNRTLEWTMQNRQWGNHPIISFGPYRNLFEFLFRGKEFPKEYTCWYQGLFSTRGMSLGLSDEELIEKRTREFKMMQRELNKGMDFFINHPATAIWNDRGYFNLLDGHHRVSFLYQSGISKIPISVSLADYEKWRNTGNAKKVHNEIMVQKRVEFYQPIPNPYFLHIHPYRDEYNKSRLHHLLEYLGDIRVKKKKVIDIGANLGYMGQMFYRMGADVTMIEFDPNHYRLMEEVNKMLYVRAKIETKAFEVYEGDDIFNIAIMLTVFYPYFSKDRAVRDAFIERLNNNVSEMLIWESGDQIQLEKKYLIENTKFKKYDHICYTYATGKFREMGVFRV